MTSTTLTTRTALRPLSNTRGALIIISLFTLIFVLTSNISLLTTVQSPIADELKAFSSVSWFTSAYLIAVSSITPVAGRLCKIFSARIYLFSSIVLQSLGLFVTASAPSLSVFLVGRALTGIGGAAITPVALILVTELTETTRKGLFFGLVNTGYTTGVSLGAIVAGALEPVLGWRAIFWLQIPLAMSAATVALFSIPKITRSSAKGTDDSSIGRKLAQIDYFGILTLISSVVLLLYSLSSKKIMPIPILLSALLLGLFIIVEMRWAYEPIVPPSVFKSKGNLLTGLATIGIMSARWGVLFYTPVYAIVVRGWTQAEAGLMLLPTNTGFAVGGILVGWLHLSKGGSFFFSSLVVIVLFSLSLGVISQISTQTSNIFLYITVLFVNGLLTGALLNYSLVHLLHVTIPATHVIVLPLNAMFRGLSGSFGSAISGGIFLRTLRQTLADDFARKGIYGKDDLINRLVGTPALVNSLTGVDKEVAILGYMAALKALFIGGSVLAIFMILFQGFVGWKAPEILGEDDVLSNRDALSPIASRDAVSA